MASRGIGVGQASVSPTGWNWLFASSTGCELLRDRDWVAVLAVTLAPGTTWNVPGAKYLLNELVHLSPEKKCFLPQPIHSPLRDRRKSHKSLLYERKGMALYIYLQNRQTYLQPDGGLGVGGEQMPEEE